MARSYDHTTYPAFDSFGASRSMREEFSKIEAGFALIEADVDAGLAAAAGVAELIAKAEAAANSAIAYAQASKWVSGSSIAEGDARWSPLNGMTYRAKTAIASSTTDPSLDSGTGGNWWLGAPTNFGHVTVNAVNFSDVGYVFVDKGDSGTATQTINVADGTHQRIKATGNLTIAFSNWPTSGNTGEVLLELAHDGTARSITFPTGCNFIKYDGSVTTTFSETLINLQSADSAIDWLYFWTRDAGTTLYCKVVR